jgi:outer membrane lipoprotein carrier protein
LKIFFINNERRKMHHNGFRQISWKSIICLVFLMCCHATLGFAQNQFECVVQLGPNERSKLLGVVEERYEKFSDLRAQFTQQSYFVGLNQRVISEGSVYFKKPGMMDWNYEKPDKQRFIADGKTLWFYQPDLNQVTVGNFKEAFDSDLPVSFLLGVGHLQENFTLRSACRSSAGVVLNLQASKQDPNLQEFYLLVDKSTYTPNGAKIIDLGGNETTIVFHDLSLNVNLDDKQFAFEIPKGADVIDNRKSPAPNSEAE